MFKKLFSNIKIVYKIAIVSFTLVTYLIEKKKPQRVFKNLVNHDTENLKTALVNNTMNFLIKKQTYKVFKSAENRRFGVIYKISSNQFLTTILSLVLIDLYMYFWHRLNHEIKFLWQYHKFHHADQEMNSSSAIRFKLEEIIISTLVRPIVLIPLGVTKEILELYEAILLPIIIFHHSNIEISDELDLKISEVVTSVGIHRLHHSKNIYESNSNYGSILSIWDKLFNSYKDNKASTYIDFGI